MLTGTPPFTGATAQAILVQRFTQPAPRASVMRTDVPAVVDSAIHRALSRDPADRHATIECFARALQSGPAHAAVSDERSIAVLPFENMSSDPEFRLPASRASANLLAQVDGVRGATRATSRESGEVRRRAAECRVDRRGERTEGRERPEVHGEFKASRVAERNDRDLSDQLQDEIASDRDQVDASGSGVTAGDGSSKRRRVVPRATRREARPGCSPGRAFERACRPVRRGAGRAGEAAPAGALERPESATSHQGRPRPDARARRFSGKPAGPAPISSPAGPPTSRMRASEWRDGAAGGALGNDAEALAEAERAVADDPMSAVCASYRAAVLGVAGHSEEAIAEAQRGVAIDAESYLPRLMLACNHGWAGDADNALAAFNVALMMSGASRARGDAAVFTCCELLERRWRIRRSRPARRSTTWIRVRTRARDRRCRRGMSRGAGSRR